MRTLFCILAALTLVAGCGGSKNENKRKTKAPKKTPKKVRPQVDVGCQAYVRNPVTITTTFGGRSNTKTQGVKTVNYIQCDISHLKGPAARVCWKLDIKCTNANLITHSMCTRVGAGQTRVIKEPLSAFTKTGRCGYSEGTTGTMRKLHSVKAEPL